MAMFEKNVKDIQEVCFYAVVTAICNLQKEVNEALGEEESRAGVEYFSDFTKRIALTSAEKIIDKVADKYADFDENTVQNIWIDSIVEETNKILKSVSVFGYSFRVGYSYETDFDSVSLELITNDGRSLDIEDYDEEKNIENKVLFFIAEDILRIATGRVLKRKYRFRADEKDEMYYEKATELIIEELICCIGDNLPYEKVRNVLESNQADSSVVELCKEIIDYTEMELKK